ncbi:MAG: hypothetical protein WC342_08510 [Methanoregula sp.]|jgi:hypothetical protein
MEKSKFNAIALKNFRGNPDIVVFLTAVILTGALFLGHIEYIIFPGTDNILFFIINELLLAAMGIILVNYFGLWERSGLYSLKFSKSYFLLIIPLLIGTIPFLLIGFPQRSNLEIVSFIIYVILAGFTEELIV